MPELLETTHSSVTRGIVRPPEDVYYPDQREDDMGETSAHYLLIAELMQMLRMHLKSRSDVFLTANMNVYFVEGDPHKWVAPDILIAFGVPNRDRNVYKCWAEGVFPQVVIEVASERTWKSDLNEKLKLYEKLGVEEYYVLDGESGRHTGVPITCLRRKEELLTPIDASDGTAFSDLLGLRIVFSEGRFRLFEPESNCFLRTLDDAEAELDRLKKEIEELRSRK